jgi:type II secretory pathway pseudopilin PulG
VTIEESAQADPHQDHPSAGRPGAVRRRPPVRRGHRGRRWALLGALLVVVVAGVALALLARPLVSAKHEAQAAQQDLTSAKDALKADRVNQARAYIRQARHHVELAQSDAGGLGGDAWSLVPIAGGAVDDERHLIDALDETTSVAELGVEIYPIVSGSSAELVRGQRINLELLHDVVDRTTGIGPHLDRALADLDQVSGSTPIVGGSVLDAKTTALAYLEPLRQSYRTNEPLLRSLPELLGADGPRTYLLAMLNPAELRYSGGGALSFTTMRFVDGVATFGQSVNVDDIIARGDTQSWVPLKGNTFHPRRAQRVTNSTFSPWWSVSGEELLRGYRKAFPGPRFNGLIGIDLQGLAALFELTGPIDLPGFGHITSDSLVQTLAGSYGDFDSIEQRHQLNAELVPAFRQQFFEGGRTSDKVKSLVESAKGRHFVVYFRSPAVERKFARLDLTGDVSPTSYDYLGVFSQNLNGSKTDYWQHREVTSTVQLQPDGSAQVNLHVAVTNRAPPYELPIPDPKVGYTTRYLGTRIGVFLPRRSTLESTRLDDTPTELTVHLPRVRTVRNRKYVEASFLLNSGDSSTIDLSYRMAHAAKVLDQQTMTYRLDVDPQDLVSAQLFHISVAWPDGYRSSGALPAGWKATKKGGAFDGPITTRMAWEIPLTKG